MATEPVCAAGSARAGPTPELVRHTTYAIRASEIEPTEIEWLWEGFLAFGKIAVLDGDPGVGKTLLTHDLAARVSRGLPMPLRDAARPPIPVLFISCEDGLADTVVPRLIAAGADLSRVSILPALRNDRLPEIPADLQAIGREIESSKARLLIIDPLMAYLPSEVNTWKDQSVRTALAPLAKLAEETGCAVLLVRHPTKGEHVKAIHAGGGSVGIIGLARVGLLAAPDPSDPETKILAVSKCNVMQRAPSLRYRIIEGAGTTGTTSAPRIKWLGESGITADELVRTESTSLRPRDEAADFLRELLADGPIPATEVQAQSARLGIATATLGRAKKAVGATSNRREWFEGRGIDLAGSADRGWFWWIPSRQKHTEEVLGATSPSATQAPRPITTKTLE